MMAVSYWRFDLNASQTRTAYVALCNLNTLINDTMCVTSAAIPDIGTERQRSEYERTRKYNARCAMISGIERVYTTIINNADPGARYKMRGVTDDELNRMIDSFRKIFATFDVLSETQKSEILLSNASTTTRDLVSFASNVFLADADVIMGIKTSWTVISDHKQGGIDCVIV